MFRPPRRFDKLGCFRYKSFMKARRFNLVFAVVLLSVSACSSLSPTPTATQPIPTATFLSTPEPTIQFATMEPTPRNEARFEEANLALAFGDYQEALTLYASPPPANTAEYQAAGIYGLGLTYMKLEDFFQARRQFDALLVSYPDSAEAARAHFLMGMMDAEEERFASAVEEYQAYLDGQPEILEAEVYTRLGDLYLELGENGLALEAFKQAYLAPQLGINLSAAQQVAALYEESGRREDARAIYEEILLNTTSDYVNAQMNLLIGRSLVNQGELDEGYVYYQYIVNNFPFTYDSYSALVALVEAGQPVDELQRGIINYNMGQNRLAVEAFDRYLQGEGMKKDTALYYNALAVRARGVELAGLNSAERNSQNQFGGTEEDKEAIQLWTTLIDEYPQSTHRLDAIEDIVYTQNTYMGQMKLATETALAYAALPHAEEYAPTLLNTAANYYLLDGKPLEAANTWTVIGVSYPGAADAFNGLFFAGSLYYELDELDLAAQNFNRALLIADVPLETAGSYFWLGKVRMKSGEGDGARLHWQNAQMSDPQGYYGLRAAELSEGKSELPAVQNPDFEVNFDDERILAAEWLKTAFSLPVGTNTDYSSELAADLRYQRGLEYDRLGMYSEADAEFEALRLENVTDAVDTFRLLKRFLDQGYYRSAIECSRTIISLAGYADNPVNARIPVYFAYAQYGPYYQHWVSAAAAKYNVDELLLYSLIYQESRFAVQVQSSAGARGLMQLMPATAQQIASETGFLSNFEAADLDVPYYNLELGTNYLARQLYVFDGDTYSALAAYNSGPGNVMRWKESIGEDPDVFLNAIRYLETRTYLRRIEEIYHQYSLIYGR